MGKFTDYVKVVRILALQFWRVGSCCKASRLRIRSQGQFSTLEHAKWIRLCRVLVDRQNDGELGWNESVEERTRQKDYTLIYA